MKRKTILRYDIHFTFTNLYPGEDGRYIMHSACYFSNVPDFFPIRKVVGYTLCFFFEVGYIYMIHVNCTCNKLTSVTSKPHILCFVALYYGLRNLILGQCCRLSFAERFHIVKRAARTIVGARNVTPCRPIFCETKNLAVYVLFVAETLCETKK